MTAATTTPAIPGRARALAPGRRVLDLTVGTVLAVLATPVILVLAVGVSVALRATPLFGQRRVGAGGRPFTMLKLRTLPRSVSPTAPKHDLVGVDIPRLCAFLRRTHLDELPQLWLVPVGPMSLVGPRPEVEEIAHDRYEPGFAEARTAVGPGCTGLWQISVDHDALICDAPEYDLFYVSNRSLRLDAWILRRTARVMAGGRRIHLSDVPAWASSPPDA